MPSRRPCAVTTWASPTCSLSMSMRSSLAPDRAASVASGAQRAKARLLHSGYDLGLQEIADAVGDLAGVGLEREVTGVEEADDGTRIVAPECLGARRHEERIVPAPYREERRLVRAEILLERRIERDIALVVAEQVELYLVRSRTCEIEIVQVLPVRRHHRRIGDAVGVLPAGRRRGEERAQRLSVLR